MIRRSPGLARRRPALRALRRATEAVGLGAVGLPTAGHRALPHFLIIGAQRCGTTSLFRWLVEQPTVVPPLLGAKGVHYFDTAYGRSLRWYRAHFPTERSLRRHARGAITGEASPYYLFHPAAADRIAATLADVRLIVMLRDPVERAVSHYHHMVLEGHETVGTLEEALELEEERLAGEERRLLDDPRYASPSHQHHSYLARGRYAEQLERYLGRFDRGQLLVLSSRAVFEDPARWLRTVSRFLDLPAPSTTPPPRRYTRYNAGAYPPVEPVTRERLRAYFRPHDERLFDLLGQRLY